MVGFENKTGNTKIGSQSHFRSSGQIYESNYIEPEKIQAFRNNEYDFPAKKSSIYEGKSQANE